MVCTWTNSYTYQPNTPEDKKCDYDRVCEAIIKYVEEYGSKHYMRITTTIGDESWYSHGKPVEITCYNLQSGMETTPIEEVATDVILWYESALEDEITNFDEEGVYIGEPWSAEDLEVFTREAMVEYWG